MDPIIAFMFGFMACALWMAFIDWLYDVGMLKELGDDDGPEISD